MINIKENIDGLSFYIGSNLDEFLNEIDSKSPFEFFDTYLLELMPREFYDFSFYLLDLISDIQDRQEITDSIIDLLKYLLNDKLTEDLCIDFSSYNDIKEHFELLLDNHLTEKIRLEKLNLNGKISLCESKKHSSSRI